MDENIKKNNLTKEDILEFAKLTASSADDCVREIDSLIEAKGAKEKELEDLTQAEDAMSVEDKVRNQRAKEKIRKDIKTLEQNIEATTERGLILERSCDVNQEVASQLEGKDVNYRTTRRLADKADISGDVKELRGRLSAKERKNSAAKSKIKKARKTPKKNKLLKTLMAIAAIIMMILLLLRQCVGFDKVKRTVFNIVGMKDDKPGDGTYERNKFGFDRNGDGSDIGDGGDTGDGVGKRNSLKFGLSPDGEEYGEGTDEFNRFGFDRDNPEGVDGTEDTEDAAGEGKNTKLTFNTGDGSSQPGQGTDENNKFGFDRTLSRGSTPEEVARRRNQVSSDEWKRNYTGKVVRDDMITIPYKDPAVPFDDLEIEYYLLDGDFASGFNTIAGSLLGNTTLGKKRLSIDDIMSAYNSDHGIEEDVKPESPPSIAEQLAAEDERRANKLQPDDKFYTIDISNNGTSKQEIIEKMSKESPYVTMESQGTPVVLSAGLMPYSVSAVNVSGDSLFPPKSPPGWSAGLDLSGHYKFINEPDKQLSAGLRVGAFTDPVTAIQGDYEKFPIDVPVMAELKGKFNKLEVYTGAGVVAGTGDGSWNAFGFGLNPAVELGVGYDAPLPVNEHSSLSFGIDSKLAFNTNAGWSPMQLNLSPYVRYNHALDTFEPVDKYYYDIAIENDDIKSSEYGYDILIENDDSDALKKREEEKKPENILKVRLESKGLDANDDYYSIRVDNDVVNHAVKRDEKVSGASQTITDAAVAALMAGDTQSYNIIINEDANPVNREKIINEYYNRYQYYEYEKLNNDWLAAQDQNNNAKLGALYGDTPQPQDTSQSVEQVNSTYLAEETYEGTPIDAEIAAMYAFGIAMYQYRVESANSVGLINKTTYGLMAYTSEMGMGVSIGMRYRIVNFKDFQFFVGARTLFQFYKRPTYDAYSLFAEIGIGVVGLNVYGGVGADFSGAYNHNAGLAFLLGVDYSLYITKHLAITAGVNANLGIGKDDSEVTEKVSNIYYGGSRVIDNTTLSINPYIGVKVSFDGRTVKYKEVLPEPQREYNILVDRGESGMFDDLDNMTFEELEEQSIEEDSDNIEI